MHHCAREDPSLSPFDAYGSVLAHRPQAPILNLRGVRCKRFPLLRLNMRIAKKIAPVGAICLSELNNTGPLGDLGCFRKKGIRILVLNEPEMKIATL